MPHLKKKRDVDKKVGDDSKALGSSQADMHMKLKKIECESRPQLEDHSFEEEDNSDSTASRWNKVNPIGDLGNGAHD